MTKCFWLEPTGELRRSFRRFVHHADMARGSACLGGYHNAKVLIDTVAAIYRADGRRRSITNCYPASHFEDDPRWPAQCAHCDYHFTDEDEWQVFTEALYDRADDGAVMSLREAPPGAMWDAIWYPNCWTGADGRSLVVKCPDGHEWCIDARASNCTMKDDDVHKCWVRHGTPPMITVDKNGHTCAAGAGSILTKSWHGFLRNGVFVPC